MALEGSITFKGLTIPRAYLDIHKIVIDVESMSANMEYKVYADQRTFTANKNEHLTTHIEVVPVTSVIAPLIPIVSSEVSSTLTRSPISKP